MIRATLVLPLILILSLFSFPSITKASTNNDIRVGVFYYPWYNGTIPPSSTCPNQGQWNGTLNWTVKDTPLLGFYNSSDPNVIDKQLSEMNSSGIDFIIVSWWGPNSFEDYATKTLFSQIKQYNYPIQVVIMVEAYNWSGIYDFKAICDYINSTYIAPYRSIYLNLYNLPLICFFNDNINMTRTEENITAIYSVSGFTTRIVGQSSYVDWYAWTPCSVNSSWTPYLNNKDGGVVTIEPRYDGSHIDQGANSAFDSAYSQGLYNDQWNYVLQNKDKIKYVLIYSWNEYHERSQIEPCNDSTSYEPENSTLNLGKTRYYISQIKSIESSYSLFPLIVIVGGLTTVVILTSVYVIHRRKRFRK
jgi:hypothetical protein